VLVGSALFMVNQTAQVVLLANTISPVLARIVLVSLLVLYAVAILVPVTLFIRLPKSISPPKDEQSSEYPAYLCRLGKRLSTNPELTCAGPLDDRASIESSLKVLDAKADDVIKGTASILFVTTAVSQNGSLNAIMVLAQQTRLIWRVARVYNQRPTVAEFGRLYANVGATLFATVELGDLDIRDQIQPVIQAVFGHAVVSLVPGIDKLASIVMQCLINGAADAYLTLRVGIICKSYCRPITAINRKRTSRQASIAAASMLGLIVSASAASVSKAIVAAARKAGETAVESAAAGVRGVAAKLNPFKVTANK